MRLIWALCFVLHRYDGLVARGLEEIPPFLTRSAFAGSQRYGAILWSGDIESTFDELAVQVQVAQHVAMSGIYWWCVISDSFGLGSINRTTEQALGSPGGGSSCYARGTEIPTRSVPVGQRILAALEMATQQTQPSKS